MASKIILKEKKVKKSTQIVNIFNISARIFLLLLIGDVLVIFLSGGIDFVTLLFLFITVVLFALSSSTASLIETSPTRKENAIKAFFISALFTGLIAILVLAAYRF